MRALTLVTLAAALTATAGCAPEEPKDQSEPEWLQPPKSYDPASADLTFNKERLEKFNAMSEDERASYIAELTATKGSFKGQAIFKSGAGLGEAMADLAHGAYELSAGTEGPVLYEITIDYNVFTTPELGKPLAPHAAIEFTGTLIDLNFQDEDKPRKLSVRVKADDVKRLKD